MIYKTWRGYLLAAREETLFPEDAADASSTEYEQTDKEKILFLVNRDPFTSRGVYAVDCMEEIDRETTAEDLRADAEGCGTQLYRVVNTAFPGALDQVLSYDKMDCGRKLTATLVGLGDVGGTVLMGLKLLGKEFSEIRIFDPNESACKRYETELNQVLCHTDGETLPVVTICTDAQLFDCDVFLFTASRGVPGLDTKVTDVRMAQFEANKKMLDAYAKMARDRKYRGIFCQISDPVDHLSREVFLASNRNEAGEYDFAGLLPEQIQGFGLGVMSARAAYYAEEGEKTIVYGPHGKGLIVANAAGEDYDETRSQELTKLTTEANLRVRELGYKPYIAPGLSSAAISVLRMVRGQEHHGAVPLDGAYFGCRSRFTKYGIFYSKEAICDRLMERIKESHKALKEFSYED